MKKKGENKKRPRLKTGGKEKNNLNGYPIYPASEDIYSKYQEDKNTDPEDISKIKGSINDNHMGTIKDTGSYNDLYDSDLDIPGSELDDEQENIGSEDEENNYYSLGGDDHDDLEEDKGE